MDSRVFMPCGGPHCRADEKYPELRFRALLTGGASEMELTLV
jgi:hypothetical protein